MFQQITGDSDIVLLCMNDLQMCLHNDWLAGWRNIGPDSSHVFRLNDNN